MRVMAKKLISVRVEESLLAAADERARAAGSNRSAWIEGVLRSALGQESSCAEEARPVAAAPVETARVQVPPAASGRAPRMSEEELRAYQKERERVDRATLPAHRFEINKKWGLYG